MTTARIQLLNCETFQAKNGRRFKKNEAHIVNDPAEIDYFRRQPEFAVTELVEVQSNRKESNENAQRFNREKLEQMNKRSLVKLASEAPFNLAMEMTMRKDDMVAAILNRQAGKDPNEGLNDAELPASVDDSPPDVDEYDAD